MSFADDLHHFTVRLDAKAKAVFVNTAAAVKDSIQHGSSVTGAPGQPVDTGFLKASWILAFPTATTAEITTNVSYAPVIEDNLRASYDPKGVQPPRKPVTEGGTNRKGPSTVGGHHSVKLTVGGFERLVAAQLAKGGG